MLAAVHPTCGGDWRGINWKHVPNITQEDNDALECMVVWWSTEPAGIMRSIAEPMIETANRKAASRLFNRFTEDQS